ncbi:hypothetical protein C8J56DRAFT_250366 [Mycena floridula]|nr:hypothetical protein C8J56DRAFT_250366 [Mycena floridula]
MNSHTSLLESLAKIVSYTTKLDPSMVRVVFFGSLTSLQTIIRLMGAQVSDDNILRALTMKLCNIALNLNMEHPEWPFTAEDEGEVVAAIAHIESILNSGQPPASVPVTTEDVDHVGPHLARSNDYAHGSSAQIHGQNIIAGTVGGSILSHNTINLADPAVRRKVDNLREHIMGKYLIIP